MKPLKIYFLSSEIYPFSNTYSVAKFSSQFSTFLHENKEIDIRLCQPKYGYISERKYILREVIRLRDMQIDFLGEEHLTNLKSAFIPETRVQVYFMEHADYFQNVPDIIYKSRNGRIFQNNHEKFLFFVHATFETLKKLFWVPDIIVCNDWQTAFLSQLLKKHNNDKLFKNIKIVTMIHSYNENYLFPNTLFDRMNLEYNKKNKVQNACDIISQHSDLNYIFDDDKIINKMKKTTSAKKLLSSKKTKSINSYYSKESSEKIDIFNEIIDDFKSII